MTYAQVFPGKWQTPSGRRWWYVRLRAGNHRTLSVSEGYTRKSDAVRGARRAYPDVEVRVVDG